MNGTHKTNIVVIDRDGDTTATCFDEVQDALDAYETAKADPGNQFVGLLKKPPFAKRGKPEHIATIAAHRAERDAQAAARAEQETKREQWLEARRTVEAARETLEQRMPELPAQ